MGADREEREGKGKGERRRGRNSKRGTMKRKKLAIYIHTLYKTKLGRKCTLPGHHWKE